MKILTAAQPVRVTIATMVMALLLSAGFVQKAPAAAERSPLSNLLGSWGGNGLISMTDGRRERINCNAYYTGNGSQLGLAIYCKSPTQDIKMRGQVSYSGGRLSGNWEERTFNAGGSLNGTVSGNRLRMKIGGNLNGLMVVSYSRSRQNVSISTQGIGMKSVNINLARR